MPGYFQLKNKTENAILHQKLRTIKPQLFLDYYLSTKITNYQQRHLDDKTQNENRHHNICHF